MKLLIIEQWLHHKNKIGIIFMLEYLKNNNLIPNLTYTLGTLNDLKIKHGILYIPPQHVLMRPNIKTRNLSSIIIFRVSK